MNPSFLAELRRIVGDTHVLDDALELLTYECDALPHLREQPAAVALPGSAAEVQAIVRLCARDGVPFVPWEDFDDVRSRLEAALPLPGAVAPERCPGWRLP